jgi:hypothetical protein
VIALTVLLVAGSAVRLVVLVLRPTASARFRHPRRRILATRLEHLGDIVVLVTAAGLVFFGYGHHPAAVLLGVAAIALVAGFASVLLAHDIARRHRSQPAPPAVVRRRPRPDVIDLRDQPVSARRPVPSSRPARARRDRDLVTPSGRRSR